jgi:hypothetical protein
MDSKKN